MPIGGRPSEYGATRVYKARPSKGIVVEIDGVNVTNIVEKNSLRIVCAATRRISTCTFRTISIKGSVFTPQIGKEIKIYQDGEKVFAGIVDRVNQKVKTAKYLYYEITCGDYSLVANQRLVNESYENETVNDIISDIVSKYLKGFTTNNVGCSLTISSIKFNYLPVVECLKKLAEQVNYEWYIDFDKDIHFFKKGDETASWGLTDTGGRYVFKSLEIEKSYNDIRNYIYLQGRKPDQAYSFTTLVKDDDSIEQYGRHDYRVASLEVATTGEAIQIGNSYLEAYKDPSQEGVFVTRKSGLRPGQKITIQSAIRDINEDYIIDEVIATPRGTDSFWYRVKFKKQRKVDLPHILNRQGVTEEDLKSALFSHITKDPLDHPNDSITSAKAKVALRGWSHDIEFSATDHNTVSWSSGTITLSDGTAYSINAGNTGNMTGLTFIYLDVAVSTTDLQTTTTASESVGDGKILIAVAQPNSDTSSKAQFQVFGGRGGISLMVDNIVANSSYTNEIITNTAQIADAIITNAKISDLSADKITSGTITSQSILLAITDGQGDAYIAGGNNLDLANWRGGDANGGAFILGLDDSATNNPAKLFIGNYSTSKYFQYDGTDVKLVGGTITAGTITGATIQTATSGSRVLLDTSKLVAYDDSGNEVFKVLISGTDVGNVILGDYANNKGLKYDKSANAFYVKGNITITGGSGISNLSDAGSLATKDKIGKTDCDTTIISGGKIVTDLLTASNIQTGTLDASVVNVTNLNADNITAGTLTGRRIRTASSGQRIEIDKDNHWIRFYDSNNKEEGRINPTTSAFEIKSGVAGSSISFRLSSSDGNFDLIPMELRQSGVATGLIYPMSSGAYDLGKSDKKWRNLYLSGNIYVDGNVDGVDISAHASNASAHHTKTQYLSEISINTNKYWGGYNITGVGKISANTLNIGTSSASNYISGGLYVSGGLDMEVSNITDVKYLYFNSSGGRIYYGGNLFQDFYNSPSGRPTSYTLNRETRFSTTLTPHTNCYEYIGWRSGWDGATTNRIWRVIHYGWAGTGGCSEGGVLACSPIRVENSALDVIKKVKKPKFFDKSKLTCKYGLKGSKPGKYFTEDDFPEEMKMKYPGRADGKSSIEVFRSIAILTQALKELVSKVETFEEKFNSIWKKQ